MKPAPGFQRNQGKAVSGIIVVSACKFGIAVVSLPLDGARKSVRA
jgi:hypothetical protein